MLARLFQVYQTLYERYFLGKWILFIFLAAESDVKIWNCLLSFWCYKVELWRLWSSELMGEKRWIFHFQNIKSTYYMYHNNNLRIIWIWLRLSHEFSYSSNLLILCLVVICWMSLYFTGIGWPGGQGPLQRGVPPDSPPTPHPAPWLPGTQSQYRPIQVKPSLYDTSMFR